MKTLIVTKAKAMDPAVSRPMIVRNPARMPQMMRLRLLFVCHPTT